MTPQDPQQQGQPQQNPSGQPPRPQGGPPQGQPNFQPGGQLPMQGQPPRPQGGPPPGQFGGPPNQPPIQGQQPPRPQPGSGGPPNQPPMQGQPPRPQPGPGGPPMQGQPGPNQPGGQPGANRPDFQWQPNQQPAQAGGATTQTATQPNKGLSGIVAAFRPEPSKAPPLEWVGLAVSVVLAVCGFLPWINASDGTSFSGISINDGWIVFGAGILAAVLGFVGLSRDSISLAAGQALLGLIALIFAIINLTGLVSGESAAFGLILTLVVAVIVIGLGVYNAIDAARKGAKY